MTYATDDAVTLRASIALVALAAINAARARLSGPPAALTLATYRDEAARQILVALRGRSIFPEQITRPDDLIESEVCLTVALLCEAATQKGPSRDQTAVDLFGQEATRWRLMYDTALAAASPVDGVRGRGASFPWSRG